MINAIQELHETHNVDTHAYLKQPFVHFANTQPIVAPKNELWPKGDKDIMIENIIQDQSKIEIEKDNVFVLDEMTGETMPPITGKSANKYDYDEPFSFKKKPMDGGKF
jgi:hypothetical protein